MAIRHLHIARRSSSGLALAAAGPAWAAQGPAADAAGGQEESEGGEVGVTGYRASLANRAIGMATAIPMSRII